MGATTPFPHYKEKSGTSPEKKKFRLEYELAGKIPCPLAKVKASICLTEVSLRNVVEIPEAGSRKEKQGPIRVVGPNKCRGSLED
jgi:hypothetical protein